MRAARNGFRAAEVAHVGFLADAAAELERVVVGRQKGQLGKSEVLAERRDEGAGKVLRIEADQRRLLRQVRRAGNDDWCDP